MVDRLRLHGRTAPRWALWERLTIRPEDGTPHLSRLRIVQTPWFGVHLHRFDTPDDSGLLHDHPWPFVSLVLRGGYLEQRAHGRAPVWVRWVNVKRSTDTHRIVALDRTPTWTLVFGGPRNRAWGHIHPDGTWKEHDA